MDFCVLLAICIPIDLYKQRSIKYKDNRCPNLLNCRKKGIFT